MFKQPDIASINPVARILPLLAVDSIGSTTQELGDRATQFVKGQEYIAHVLAKVGDTAYNVKVESGSLKGAILRMDLGTSAKAGDLLSLRYMQDSPVPTFFLQSSPSNLSDSKTEISSAANLISHYLKQAEGEGVSGRFQATGVVTHQPSNPQAIAQDLKNSVSKSGLFYESHLSDLVQGNQSLASIKQESQNQSSSSIANLMSQQLAILENHRMSWHGEVWPGQEMDWDVYQPQDEAGEKHASGEASSDRSVTSEMTLHLPNLGKVSAKVITTDGHMRISILAEQLETLSLLKAKRQTLADAISKNGQQLDALMVMQHE